MLEALWAMTQLLIWTVIICIPLMAIILIPAWLQLIIRKSKGEEAAQKFNQKVEFFKYSETGEFRRQVLFLSIVLEIVLIIWNPFQLNLFENLLCYFLIYAGSLFSILLIDAFADFPTTEHRDKLYREQRLVDGTFKVISCGAKISAYIHHRTYEKLLDFCKSNNKLVIGEVVDEALVQYFKRRERVKRKITKTVDEK